jgi:membrane protease YdiL (CAAX protease family)
MPLPSIRVLVLFFAMIFAGAILLGPILYFTLQLIFPTPFHRAMDRALLISALGALVFFRSRISLGRLWPLRRGAALQVLFGYLLAFVSVQAMIGAYLACCGFTSSHLHGPALIERILMAVVAVLLVPPLEETVFRGFVLVELARSMNRRWACVFAAVIFMLAHFLKIPESLDHQPIHLWSGVNAMGGAFLSLPAAFLTGRGLNLFLVGLIFGGIFLRANSLWVNAGLHSGWILALLLFSGLTRPTEPPRVAFLGGDLLSSPLTSLVLIGLGAWLWRYYPPPLAASAGGGNAPST